MPDASTQSQTPRKRPHPAADFTFCNAVIRKTSCEMSFQCN
jgi:hypothetical protein